MKPRGRVQPKVVVRKPASPQNYRQRLDVPLSLIVLHSTESHNRPGRADLEGVASWFANPAAKASSHVIVDDDGHSARSVPDGLSAWTQGNFNSYSLSIEQIGFAKQGKSEWREDDEELHETARWMARWSLAHGIPLRRGQVDKDARSPIITKTGVVSHNQLGQLGGGHTDPGAYPFDAVIDLAKQYRQILINRSTQG